MFEKLRGNRQPELLQRDTTLIGDYEAERQALEAADGPRCNRMRLYRREVEHHREQLDIAEATRSDYGRGIIIPGEPDRQRHDIRLPYALAQTVKHTYRTAGRLPDITVERLDGSEEEQHRQATVEKMLWHSYRQSGDEVSLADVAWDGSLLGASVIEPFYDLMKGCPAWRVSDPAQTHVVPGAYNPHELQRVYCSWAAPKASVIAEYRDKPLDLLQPEWGIVDVNGLPDGEHKGGVELVTVHEMKDDTRCIRWCGDVVLYHHVHNYGFTPAVVIPNIGPSRMLWGYSDYELVRGVARYYEKFLSRQADVIAFVANGAYVAEKTGLAAATIRTVIREGGILPVKEGGRVEPIQAPDQPVFVERHGVAMETALFDLGFTSPASWGRGGAVSSGTERQMQLQPESELAQLKQAALGAGLERLNAMLLQLWEKKHVGSRSYRGSIRQRGMRRPYAMTLGPTPPAPQPFDAADDPSQLDPELAATQPLSTDPRELIDGDYQTTVSFKKHLDVHDPQFILAEVNKFSQGVQSLKTTLENLGVQAAEDEMQLIEQEAERFPWLRSGVIAFTKMQLDAQTAQEGQAAAASDVNQPPQAAQDQALGMSGTPGLGFDALATALNGNGDTGRPPGAPTGSLYGGA